MWLSWYLAQIEGNVLSMPACGLIAAAGAVTLRRPLAALWHHVVGDRADLDDIRREAQAARKIAADLFEHHTNRRHELAPPDERGRGDE